MSTSVCGRFEKYRVRACPNDTDVCAGFAQRDLTHLVGVCSRPTQNLVCGMVYRSEPSPLCPHTMCKVYELSMATTLKWDLEKCGSQGFILSKDLMD